MPHEFLSEDWLDAVEALRTEAPEPPDAMKDLLINLTVTDGPDGDVSAHLNAGQFERGHAEGASTKITVPHDVAKSLFVDANPQAAMQAFMGGKIKVEGDMTKLMAMQAGATPTPEMARPSSSGSRSSRPGASGRHHALRKPREDRTGPRVAPATTATSTRYWFPTIRSTSGAARPRSIATVDDPVHAG